MNLWNTWSTWFSIVWAVTKTLYQCSGNLVTDWAELKPGTVCRLIISTVANYFHKNVFLDCCHVVLSKQISLLSWGSFVSGQTHNCVPPLCDHEWTTRVVTPLLEIDLVTSIFKRTSRLNLMSYQYFSLIIWIIMNHPLFWST